MCQYFEKNSLIKIIDLKDRKAFIATALSAEIIAFDISHTQLVALDASGMLFVWDHKGEKLKCKFPIGMPLAIMNGDEECGNAYISSLKIYGEYVVNSSCNQNIEVWDCRTKKLVVSLKGHVDKIVQIDVVKDKLISGSKDGTLRIWDLSHFDAMEKNGKGLERASREYQLF